MTRSRWTAVAGSQGEILRWERWFGRGSSRVRAIVFAHWHDGVCRYWWYSKKTLYADRGPYLTHGGAKRAATAAQKRRGKP